MIKPNFFIVGAPKCGTSAMYHYLSTHPEIYLSRPKEPNYFCDDFNDAIRLCHREKDYLNLCFSEARESCPVVGEGSVFYLYSNRALKRIKAFNPQSKIVVMLRNPVEMAVSWHNHLYYHRQETLNHFVQAWELQKERMLGYHIPKRCPEPKFLQYKGICSLGSQLREVFSLFHSAQVLPILFDDFKQSPKDIYEQVLTFLELPTDGRSEFPPLNTAKSYRSVVLANWIMPVQRRMNKSRSWQSIKKKILKDRNFKLLNTIKQKNSVKDSKKPITSEVRQMLISEFEYEIELVEELMQRQLSHWRSDNTRSNQL